MRNIFAKLGLVLGTIATTLTISTTVQAADFSFRGSFNQDDDSRFAQKYSRIPNSSIAPDPSF
jgi:hypothetical protein